MNEDALMQDIATLVESWRRRGISADLHVRLVFACSTDPAMHPRLLVDDGVLTGGTNNRRSWRETKTRGNDTFWAAGHGPAGEAITGPCVPKEIVIGPFADMAEARAAAEERHRNRDPDAPREPQEISTKKPPCA